MKRIFILYSFSIVGVYIFLYKFDQSLCSLTLSKSYMRSKKKWREYLYYPILLSLDVSHGVLVNLAEPRLSFDASHGVLVNLPEPGRSEIDMISENMAAS